jgi:pimeloyl-ACP methyl ester carboxylesterase
VTDIITQQFDYGGHPIHTLQAGPDSGPLILLLHGKMFQAATWQETGTLAKLAEAGYHVVALDLPGFGNSPFTNIEPSEVLKIFPKQSNPSWALHGRTNCSGVYPGQS